MRLTITLRRFASFMFLNCSFFWIWALKNTLTDSLDLGVISFLAVILCSIWILVLTKKMEDANNSNESFLTGGESNVGRNRFNLSFALEVLVISISLVCVNYLYGGIETLKSHQEDGTPLEKHDRGFVSYCFIFAILYFLAALYGIKIILSTHQYHCSSPVRSVSSMSNNRGDSSRVLDDESNASQSLGEPLIEQV